MKQTSVKKTQEAKDQKFWLRSTAVWFAQSKAFPDFSVFQFTRTSGTPYVFHVLLAVVSGVSFLPLFQYFDPETDGEWLAKFFYVQWFSQGF